MSRNQSKSNVVVVGPSTSTILTIVFVVLKLVGVIDWSWWWVLAPMWAPISILLVIMLFALIMGIIAELLK